ncbi:hypothetical protein [Streptomyces sp. NPDC002851]
MRSMLLHSARAFGVAVTATVLLLVTPLSPAATAGQKPLTCDTAARADGADSHDFPIGSRIKGGPATYHAGGGLGEWTVELRNTAKIACGNIHPIVVLLDRDRDLTAAQAKLEFRDPDGRWHPVVFRETDEAGELVGVFDGSGDGFTGFSIAPGRTLAVPVRLGFTSDAGENEVTASVAVVQRRGADGDWIGESRDYRFTLLAASDAGTGRPPAQLAGTGGGTDTDDRALLALGSTAAALVLGGAALVTAVRRRRSR